MSFAINSFPFLSVDILIIIFHKQKKVKNEDQSALLVMIVESFKKGSF